MQKMSKHLRKLKQILNNNHTNLLPGLQENNILSETTVHNCMKAAAYVFITA